MIQRKSLSYRESAIASTKRTRLLTYANKINVQVINSKLYEILREVRVRFYGVADPQWCPSGSVNILIFIENEECYCSVTKFFSLQTVVTKIFQTKGITQEEIVQWPCPLIDRLSGLLRKIELFTCCSVGFKCAKKCIGGRAPPQTPLGELTTLPSSRPPIVGWGGEPHPQPPRRLRRLDSRAFGPSILVPPWKPGVPRWFRTGYGPASYRLCCTILCNILWVFSTRSL